MSEQVKAAAERLNAALILMNDRGRERLLDMADGYIRGYRDGVETVTEIRKIQPQTAGRAGV